MSCVVRLLAATFLATATVVVPAVGDAAAAADGACPGRSGITVVVDSRELGGEIVVRCAPGSPQSGFDALAGAGFTAAPPLRTPGFVCRIDGRPSAGTEACVATPPTSAYWSYWRAPRGGSWTYSSNGALGPPAEVEGWSFALNRTASDVPPPGIPPPPATPTTTVPANRPPTTTPSPVIQPGVAGVSTTRPASRGSTPNATTTGPGPGPGPATSSQEGATTSTSTSTAADAGSAGATTSTAAGRLEVASVAAGTSDGDGDGDGSGPGATSFLAVALVLALGGGAAIVSRRRASAATDGSR